MLNMLSQIGVQQMSEKTEKLQLGIAYECVKCGAVVDPPTSGKADKSQIVRLLISRKIFFELL